jgi:ubiquinone/menaquinone biosynthesis C-methylase UbiE
VLLLSRRPGLSVLAVDMAEEMLRLAARNLALAGFEDACAVAKMDAKALDVPSASFDLVMSNSLAHHLPEPLDLFREIARVVKPGGAVLVRDLLRPESPEAARAIVERVTPDDSPRQKQLFFDSAGLEGAAVAQVSDRHWSVERPRRASP